MALARLLAAVDVVHGRQQSDASGYGVIARQDLPRGSILVDPTAKVIPGAPPTDLDPTNSGEVIIGRRHYVVLSQGGVATSLTYFLNEAPDGIQPNITWKIGQEGGSMMMMLHWEILENIKQGEELVVVYDLSLRQRRLRQHSRFFVQNGWQLLTQRTSNSNAAINVGHGPPVKFENCSVKPPDFMRNPSQTIRWVNNGGSGGSGAGGTPHRGVLRQVMTAPRSEELSAVARPGENGFKEIASADQWEGAAYGSIYIDSSLMRKMLQQLGVDHTWAPRGCAMAGALRHQIFLSSQETWSCCHRDKTSSVLFVTAGSKSVYLLPPMGDEKLGIKKWSDGGEYPDFLDYDVFADADRSPLWKRADLLAGESVFIPKDWWHDVRSSIGTVALSISICEPPLLNAGLEPQRRCSIGGGGSKSSSGGRGRTSGSSNESGGKRKRIESLPQLAVASNAGGGEVGDVGENVNIIMNEEDDAGGSNAVAFDRNVADGGKNIHVIIIDSDNDDGKEEDTQQQHSGSHPSGLGNGDDNNQPIHGARPSSRAPPTPAHPPHTVAGSSPPVWQQQAVPHDGGGGLGRSTAGWKEIHATRQRSRRQPNTFKCGLCGVSSKGYLFIPICQNKLDKPQTLRCTSCCDSAHDWGNISKTDYDLWGSSVETKKYHCPLYVDSKKSNDTDDTKKNAVNCCCFFKKCEYTRCSKRALYKFEDEHRGTFCAQHKAQGIVDVESKRCELDGCSKRAVFNFESEQRGRFCTQHKLRGMVDVKHKRCEYSGYTRQPLHNVEGNQKGRLRGRHQVQGIMDVRIKGGHGLQGSTRQPSSAHITEEKRARCQERGCRRVPSFNYYSYGKLKQDAKYCEEHKLEGMVNVVIEVVQRVKEERIN